jgi:hypothetical protein
MKRTPIIDKNSEFNFENINKEWLFLTEVIKREI